jgi:hypothetical protein
MTDKTQEQRIAAALGADTVIPKLEREGPLNTGELLASRAWVDDRRSRLSSTGGRPSDPNWVLRRQIPFASSTWDALKEIADQLSIDAKVAPGQVAAILLEEAVTHAGEPNGKPAAPFWAAVDASLGESRPTDSGEVMFIEPDDEDARFINWRQPDLFAGAT